MRAAAYTVAVLVAVLNISLHYYGRKATGGDLAHRLISPEFLRAFFLGLVSLIGIFAFYRYSEEDMARGIVIMGAVSIIGGTLFAISVREGEIQARQWIDWALVAMLAVILGVRIFNAFIKRS